MNGIHDQHKEHCLDIEVLITAYTKGIFPMAESQFEEKIFWVEPKYRGVIPFILIQLGVLIALAIFPELVTALPEAVYGS